MIPPIEIKEANRQAILDSGELTSDEAVSAVTIAFGFERIGPDLRAVITEQFEVVVNKQ